MLGQVLAGREWLGIVLIVASNVVVTSHSSRIATK